MAYKSASAWCPRVVARDTIQYLWQLHLAQPHQYVVHTVPGMNQFVSKEKCLVLLLESVCQAIDKIIES